VAILQTHRPLASLGLRSMESGGNFRLNVRLGTLRDRAPSLINHPNLVWGMCQAFHQKQSSRKAKRTAHQAFRTIETVHLSWDIMQSEVKESRPRGPGF
jgi:hypothetical protein